MSKKMNNKCSNFFFKLPPLQSNVPCKFQSYKQKRLLGTERFLQHTK